MTTEIEHKAIENRKYLLFLISLGFLLISYPILRYGGWWGETDTSYFTNSIYWNLKEAKLIPEWYVYANGYGYQALVSFFIHTTGISLSSFQLFISTLLAVWLVVPAWLAYRELTRSELVASLAVVVLLSQPELLFPLLRGTHEKFTRGLMFFCLYLLVRSLRARSVRQMAPLVVCFYLAAYGITTYNSFFATSFILILLITLIILWVIEHWLVKTKTHNSRLTTKLLYVVISMLVVAFIFTFYAYPPAVNQLRVLESVWDRIVLLFLQVEETATDPYQVVNTGWISQWVYFLVSLANWLLLGGTLLLWVKQTYTWFIKRVSNPEQHELVLWVFYASFALFGATSIVVDVSGAIAKNLQHRAFPSFVMIAAPVASLWLIRLKRQSESQQRFLNKMIGLILGLLIVLAVIKATNEPLLSNYWTFYSPGEMASVIWAEDTLVGRSLWTGSGGRVAEGYTINAGTRPETLWFDPYDAEYYTNDFIISDVTRLYAARTGYQLPIQPDSLVTYDNGDAQIYHRRPRTPFQK